MIIKETDIGFYICYGERLAVAIKHVNAVKPLAHGSVFAATYATTQHQ